MIGWIWGCSFSFGEFEQKFLVIPTRLIFDVRGEGPLEKFLIGLANVLEIDLKWC